jgi:hypothetical protein
VSGAVGVPSAHADVCDLTVGGSSGVVRAALKAKASSASPSARAASGAGANLKVVQRLLGHKTAVLTLDRYGHLFPDDLDAVATAFDAAAESTAYQLRTGPNLRVARTDEK